MFDGLTFTKVIYLFIILIYLLGVYKAAEIWRNTLKVDKELRRIDDSVSFIKHKYLGYMFCMLSWLAYSSIKRQ